MPTAKTINQLTDRYGAKYALTCGLSHYFPVMNGSSKVFWVEGSFGDDDAPDCGQTPEAPLASITKALSYCSSDIPNDYIFVANHYAPAEQTYPIQISKAFVHIIGSWGAKSPTWLHADAAGTTVPAIEFVAGGANCELANLELGAGVSAPGILVSGNGLWANRIHHCRFGMILGMGAEYGIEVAAGAEMINWIIEDCRFGDLLTAAGIYVPNTAGPNSVKGLLIRNNIIRVADAGIGIHIAETTADFEDGGIFDNKITCAYNGKGDAITFAAGVKGMVDGNHVMGKDTSTLITVGTNRSIWLGTAGQGAASWGLNHLSGSPCVAEGDYEE